MATHAVYVPARVEALLRERELEPGEWVRERVNEAIAALEPSVPQEEGGKSTRKPAPRKPARSAGAAAVRVRGVAGGALSEEQVADGASGVGRLLEERFGPAKKDG